MKVKLRIIEARVLLVDRASANQLLALSQRALGRGRRSETRDEAKERLEETIGDFEQHYTDTVTTLSVEEVK